MLLGLLHMFMESFIGEVSQCVRLFILILFLLIESFYFFSQECLEFSGKYVKGRSDGVLC